LRTLGIQGAVIVFVSNNLEKLKEEPCVLGVLAVLGVLGVLDLFLLLVVVLVLLAVLVAI